MSKTPNDTNTVSDDELIVDFDKMIESNDFIIERDYLSSLIDQNNKVLYYEVENIYSDKEKRKYKNKFQLKKSPPVLIIKDDFGNETTFQLTENLTDELLGTLKEVKRAYYGFDSPKDINKPDNFIDKVVYTIKKHPFKLLLPLIIIIIFIKPLIL